MQNACLYQGDAVTPSYRLDLFGRDVEKRRSESALELPQLDPHIPPKFGVQAGEWLVEEKQFGVPDYGSAERDPLLLAARELARQALEEGDQSDNFGRPIDALLDVRLVNTLQPQAEGHVVEHGHVRVERIRLEHHRHIAITGRHVVDDRLADLDHSLGHVLGSREHPEGG